MADNYIADYLVSNSSEENPISGGTLADRFGISAPAVRNKVNEARCAGVPICSSRWGYYYSTDKEQVAKTVSSMRGRIAAQEAAIEGLSVLLS